MLDLPPTLRRSLLGPDMVASWYRCRETDAPAAVSVTGTIGVLEGTVIDADTNNPKIPSTPAAASAPTTAQRGSNFPTPGQQGATLTKPVPGSPGNQTAGDPEDFYQSGRGQRGDLFASDYTDADLDLYLYDEEGVETDFSIGTGK